MNFSIIIPVYNRPTEVEELLESLCCQTSKDFEVLIIEDGSTDKCENAYTRFKNDLDIKYFYKENSGPGMTRNYGAERAMGEYLIVLDSDVVLPPTYIEETDKELQGNPCEAFGGPDKAHPDFSHLQKAINYAMTSFFTTGGIRGGKKKLDKFYPRSFNMGIRKDVYTQLGGFSKMRFGEDIDFSIRIFEAGCRCRLFPNSWVWHKRRTDFRKFFRQVHNSGIARINLMKRHKGSLKLVHLLPAVFTIGLVLLLIGSIWCWWCLLPILLFMTIIFLDSTRVNKSIKVGWLSIWASIIQLTGYGSGFLRAWWERCVLGKDEFSAFNKNFYK